VLLNLRVNNIHLWLWAGEKAGIWADTARMHGYGQVMRKKGGWAGEEERLWQVRRKGYDQMRSEME
jgi:hypothetical protein